VPRYQRGVYYGVCRHALLHSSLAAYALPTTARTLHAFFTCVPRVAVTLFLRALLQRRLDNRCRIQYQGYLRNALTNSNISVTDAYRLASPSLRRNALDHLLVCHTAL